MIVDDFNDFEELIGEKILDKNFLLDYHNKPFPYLRRLFFAKKTVCCCFLDEVYTFSYELFPQQAVRMFHLEETIDKLPNRKLDEKN